MATIVMLLGLLIAAPVRDEASCLGFIQEDPLPMDIYVAGTEYDGFVSLAKENDLVYLNGPGLAKIMLGETYLVVRPVGKVKNPITEMPVGIYYRELATLKPESVSAESVTASVATSCHNILKGDLVIPLEPRAPVQFSGDLSRRLTPVPGGGLSSMIVFGLDDRHELAEGQVCFIGIGARDGVKVGDRFMILPAAAGIQSAGPVSCRVRPRPVIRSAARRDKQGRNHRDPRGARPSGSRDGRPPGGEDRRDHVGGADHQQPHGDPPGRPGRPKVGIRTTGDPG